MQCDPTSKFAGFETAEICFDLYSIICGESSACNTVVQYSTCSPWFTLHDIYSACNTVVFNLFTLVHPSLYIQCMQYRCIQLVHPGSPFMIYPFFVPTTKREPKQCVPLITTLPLKLQRFSITPCCVLVFLAGLLPHFFVF